jgi:pimeloyl-ACP methyl ester carboxylesterase
MKRTPGANLLALLLVLVSGCSKERLPTQPAVDGMASDRAVEMRASRRKDAAEIIGRTQSGALFAMYRPDHWKGDLVLYAHGFTLPSDPIHFPPIENLRDQLLSQGYAVAYSSFSENGLAVKDGIRQTERLVERFGDRLGRPRRVFIIGSSFGGLIAVAMAERDPERYAGVLTVSGLIGGSRGLLDYISNVRVLFDVVYPGVLPGDLLHMPPGLNVNQHIVGPAVQAMSANPQGAAIISQLVQSPVPFANGPELVGSIATALGLHFVEIGDLLQRTNGESFFDNSGVTYSGPLPAAVLADINARVARYQSTEDVQEFLDRYYETTGRLKIPMLALSNTRDPQVPSFNETRYRERVARRGHANLLEQRSFPRYGHSEKFTPEEITQAFADLVLRARTRGDHDDDDDGDDGPQATVAPGPTGTERRPGDQQLRH